jgi:hypothetical protein
MAGKILADVFVIDFSSGETKEKDKSDKAASKADKAKNKNKDK